MPPGRQIAEIVIKNEHKEFLRPCRTNKLLTREFLPADKARGPTGMPWGNYTVNADNRDTTAGGKFEQNIAKS